MKQKTAVEWFYDELMTTDVKDHVELLIKAKEMEKVQIIDAYYNAQIGMIETLTGTTPQKIQDDKEDAEQYYSQTFEK